MHPLRFTVPKQPRHTRTINGKLVLVNPDMPPSGQQHAPDPHRPHTGALGDLAQDATDDPQGSALYHFADLQEWGFNVDLVADDDGGGLVFDREHYAPGQISVLDTKVEEELERDLMRLARDSGLGGIEIIGNRLQWIKVYDTEGYPIAQDGYISEGEMDAITAFGQNLSYYRNPEGGGSGRD
jgi:hypothetical protein